MIRARHAAALAAGATVAAVATWGHVVTGDTPDVVTELHAVGGLSFIAVGVLAWARRPQSRVGLLMWAVGLTWFLGDLRLLPSSAAYTVGDMEDGLYFALVGHLVLSFPSGRLRGGLDRAVVAVAYLWASLGNVVPEVFWAPPAPPCDCAHNLLAVRIDPGRYVFAGSAHQVVNAALAVVVFAVLVRHWRAATPAGRHALAPVTWASGPILLAVVSLQTVGIIGSSRTLGTVLPYVVPIALMTLPFFLLIGIVRTSLVQLAVGRLVVELGDVRPTDNLRDVLAGAFHDPSLELVYWIEETAEYVDRDGVAVPLPERGSARTATLLERRGRPVAALLHDPSLGEDPTLMQTVAATASLALENEHLDAAVKAQLAEVRASRTRIVAAADASRRRIERDLHDGAQQRLVNVALGLRMARDQIRASDSDEVLGLLDGTAEQLRCALAELRELASGIHPTILTEAGLGPALQSLAERSAIPLEVRCTCDGRLPADVEAAAYFLVSEALANIGKHAGAEHAVASVARVNGHLRVEVLDDGRGGADPTRGSGLRGLADRIAALDGRLTIVSPPQGGTRLIAEIPCA